MMIGKYMHKRRYGKSRVIDGVYKLDFDELMLRNTNADYGIYDITDKGVVIRLGNRLILLNEDEIVQMFAVTHLLLTEGVRYNGHDSEV